MPQKLHNTWMKWGLVGLLVLILNTCSGVPPTTNTETTPSEPDRIITQTPSTNPPSPQFYPVSNLNLPDDARGPFLLIQTGLETYQIFDTHSQILHAFDLPVDTSQHDLAWGISPEGQNILFRMNSNEVAIMNLVTGCTQITNHPSSDSPKFQLELAAKDCLTKHPQLAEAEKALIDNLETAHVNSLGILTWYIDDQHLLSVLDCSETSTCLHLDNHQTGTRSQLEAKPGLVNDLWISPDGNRILLRKVSCLDPHNTLDDRYYIINTSTRHVWELPLPEDTAQPGVGWLTDNWIGIVHKNRVSGKENFSLVDIDSMSISPILKGTFDGLRHHDQGLFFLTRKGAPVRTTLTKYSLKGQFQQDVRVDGFCYWLSPTYFGKDLILSCETATFLVSSSLDLEEFFTHTALFAPAPDQTQAVVIAKNHQEAFLLKAQPGGYRQLALSETPLEILWQPDSQGFLYRSIHNLFYVDLETLQDTWVADLYEIGDYTNLNAVWINLP